MVIPCNVPAEITTGDVYFVVGPAGDTWTIPGRRKLLMDRSDVFAFILTDTSTTIRLPDVDKRGFEHLLRYVEGSSPKFTSIQTARTTLDITYRFQMIDLARSCAKYLDENLTPTTVLTIFKNLSRYSNNIHTSEPCAPDLDARCLSELETRIQGICTALLHNCLVLIDEHADEILTREEIELLDYRDLSIIASRDTLQLKNEIVLYECLMRWYRCESMRLGNKPITPATRANILGNLIYKVRFGLMKRNEFLKGPGSANIFTTNEINEILSIVDNSRVAITEGLFKNINVRRVKIDVEPKYLSERSEPVLDNKKMKIKKDKNKPSNTLLNCLTIWTVLFD